MSIVSFSGLKQFSYDEELILPPAKYFIIGYGWISTDQGKTFIQIGYQDESNPEMSASMEIDATESLYLIVRGLTTRLLTIHELNPQIINYKAEPNTSTQLDSINDNLITIIRQFEDGSELYNQLTLLDDILTCLGC